jgi:hypothetical protein
MGRAQNLAEAIRAACPTSTWEMDLRAPRHERRRLNQQVALAG